MTSVLLKYKLSSTLLISIDSKVKMLIPWSSLFCDIFNRYDVQIFTDPRYSLREHLYMILIR